MNALLLNPYAEVDLNRTGARTASDGIKENRQRLSRGCPSNVKGDEMRKGAGNERVHECVFSNRPTNK